MEQKQMGGYIHGQPWHDGSWSGANGEMTQKEKDMVVDFQKKVRQAQMITLTASQIGGLAGILYSVHHKTGFWKGFGNYILGGMILGLAVGLPMRQKIIAYQAEIDKLEN